MKLFVGGLVLLLAVAAYAGKIDDEATKEVEGSGEYNEIVLTSENETAVEEKIKANNKGGDGVERTSPTVKLTPNKPTKIGSGTGTGNRKIQGELSKDKTRVESPLSYTLLRTFPTSYGDYDNDGDIEYFFYYPSFERNFAASRSFPSQQYFGDGNNYFLDADQQYYPATNGYQSYQNYYPSGAGQGFGGYPQYGGGYGGYPQQGGFQGAGFNGFGAQQGGYFGGYPQQQGAGYNNFYRQQQGGFWPNQGAGGFASQQAGFGGIGGQQPGFGGIGAGQQPGFGGIAGQGFGGFGGQQQAGYGGIGGQQAGYGGFGGQQAGYGYGGAMPNYRTGYRGAGNNMAGGYYGGANNRQFYGAGNGGYGGGYGYGKRAASKSKQ